MPDPPEVLASARLSLQIDRRTSGGRWAPMASGTGGPRLAAAAAVVAVILAAVAAKLPETVLPISTDSGMYATYARLMLQGEPPYVAFYDIHPPLAYHYWMVVETLAGTDWSRTCLGAWGVFAPQPCVSLLANAIDACLTLAAAWLAYVLARRLDLPALVGVLAAVFIAWFANVSMISMEGSNPTKLTLVPSTLAVYAFVRALDSRSATVQWAIGAGAAGMLAVLAKQPGLMTLIALFVYIGAGPLRRPRQRATLGLGISIGAAVVGLVMGLYLWRIGSLGGFLDQPWRYNFERLFIGYWQTPTGLTTPTARIDRVATQAAGLLFVAALLGGLAVWLDAGRPRQRLLLVWAGCNLAAVAGFREFDQVVPSLALLAAIGVGRMWQAASSSGLGLGRPLSGRIALVVLLGAIFALSTSFQVIQYRRAWFESGPGGVPSDPLLIASYLRNAAPPGPLFVWGNAGQIYAMSGRQPASRFVIAEFTSTTSPRVNLSRAQVMEDVRAQPPAVVVLAPHSDDADLRLSGFPAFEKLLADCYHQVSPGATVPAWGVYVANPPGAGSPPPDCGSVAAP